MMKENERYLSFELLYFDDCPSWKNALVILEKCMDNLGIFQEISLVRVESHKEAKQYKFSGSPTLRVNGTDLFPAGQADYALICRVYQTPEGFKGWPTEEMVNKNLLLLLEN